MKPKIYRIEFTLSDSEWRYKDAFYLGKVFGKYEMTEGEVVADMKMISSVPERSIFMKEEPRYKFVFESRYLDVALNFVMELGYSYNTIEVTKIVLTEES